MGAAVTESVTDLPEKLQPVVRLWLKRLAEQGGRIPDEYRTQVARLVACSEFAGGVLLREWLWFNENVASLSSPPGEPELHRFVDRIGSSDADIDVVKSELRRFRNRRLLHVLWREVQFLSDLDETLTQLSLLADRLLDAAAHFAVKQMQPRFGRVRNVAGDTVPLVILGMGKLGGRELNFSSDIDVIFCYPEDGETDGTRKLSGHEYFARLSQRIIALLDDVTVDGFVFRMDTRLRPFGSSGPPVVSFAALESYLLQHGRDWERYAYVKARIVGPEPAAEVAAELQNNLIQPFVYRRYLDYGVFKSVREMQRLIAIEVQRRDLSDNIKLGPGGIREIEFIVQAMQLVRGGSEPALQRQALQAVLPLLVNDRGLSATDAGDILDAYRFLRRLENFIQAIRDEQTHDLPDTDIDRERLCLAMDYATWADLLADLTQHRDVVSAQFDAIAIRDQHDSSKGSEPFAVLWRSGATVEEWIELLRVSSGDEAESLAASIVNFAGLSITQQLDSISRERLERFIPTLIERVTASVAPCAALQRTLAITEKILRRSAYLALLNENQPGLMRLVDLCARSQYISDQIARYPVLLDELLDPAIYSESIVKSDLANELQQRLERTGSADSETQMKTITRFQRATMFRIAVADFSDRLPIMKVSDSLTWLAEVVLDETLDAAWSDLTDRHGVPCYVVDGVTHEAGFGVVAYGKLGGLELSYGSDLDVVFLHDSKGQSQRTNGEKQLDNAVFFARLVRRLLHFLTTQTGSGELYEIDTRLRPEGRSGLLVSSIDAFEKYQDENAWTWEHQALLRARAIAGSPKIASEFERIRRETLIERVRRDELRDDVVSMRRRMRKELDTSNRTSFDLKQGNGGIGDIEFLVQYRVLQEAGTQAELISYSDNMRQLDALLAANLLTEDVANRLQGAYRKYRLHLHRLVLDGQAPVVNADVFRSERDFVMTVWRDWLG